MATPTNGKTYTLTNVAASKRLAAVSTPGNGTNVVLSNAAVSDYQRWIYGGSKLYCMSNNQKYVLDRYNSSSSTQHNNADTWLVSEGEDANQKIVLTYDSTYDAYKIKISGASLYLTAYGTANGTASGNTTTSAGNVYWGASSTSTSQLWKFADVTPASYGNGTITYVDSGTKQRPSTLNYSRSFYTNRFSRGQCTWHCFGRAQEAYGKMITFKTDTGLNGKVWYTAVNNCSILGPSSANARENSIAVWSNSGAGHVGYVEKVDTNYIYVSEANVDMNDTLNDYAGGDGSIYRYSRSDPGRGSLSFLGYIRL